MSNDNFGIFNYKSDMYENTAIGVFVYLLGIETGKRVTEQKFNLETSVNLYQQTPLDPKLGDVLAKWQGKFFILEFKRHKDEIKDESSKSTKLNLRTKIKIDSTFCDLSKKCHYLVWPHESFGQSPEMFFFENYASVVFGSKPENTFCLNRFIKNIFDASNEFGLNKDDFENYVKGMGLTFSDKIEGVLFNFNESNIPVVYPFRDFSEMAKDVDPNITVRSLNDYMHTANMIRSSEPKKIGDGSETKKD